MLYIFKLLQIQIVTCTLVVHRLMYMQAALQFMVTK